MNLREKVAGYFKKEYNVSSQKIFIEDKPVEEINEDKFQYKQVAEIIYDLLNQNNFPIHIGLFGKWGSGKTTVIKLLEQIITSNEGDKNKYKTKLISVWKFADDAPSLHRKIVREVEFALDIKNNEGLDIETTNQESLSTTDGATLFSIKKGFIAKTLIYVSILMLIFLIAIIMNNPLFISTVTNFVSLTTIVIILGLLNVLKGTFRRTSQITTKAIALQYGDQYEERFKNAVNKYLEKNHGNNLILIFDDLDRLPPKQLVAALNSIKTFLHSDSCAFIIPCDKEILRQGIRVVLSEKADDSDIDDKFISEYLNKTFDYQIHLPILEQKNMKRYAKQLLMEQNIEWASDPDINLDRVLGVLIHSSIKTPRQTKELLNAFASDWILAKKRDNEVGKKVLTKNPLTLAVFTVIRTNFPDFYKEIEIDPYLIYKEEDIKQLGNNELLAYLSKVERYIPKDDPRPYIYFSNEKLNPATGKPAVERTKQFLINGQEEEFVKSMNELGNDDKGIVLSSLLSDIDDNAGIEVENCLKTLIHTEIDLSFVSESDIDRWDQLLRDNKDYLMKFSPSKVCKLLDQLSDNLSTWNGYGEGIDINEYYNDLVDLWISNPDYINKLGLSQLGDKLTKTFLEKNEGLKLAKRLFKIPNNNKFLNEIDWIELLNESLINEEELDFNLSTWLLEWESKTFNKIKPLHVTDLLEKYDFRSSEQIEGIGDVWCSAYENNNNGELLALINLINHDDFSGFNEENYKKLNSILEQQHGENYNQLAEVVNEMLSNWWDNGNQDRAIDFISKLYNSPGVVEFCELHFHFGLAEEELQLFLEVLIKRGQILETSSHFIEKLRTEFINAGNSHVQSKSVSIIKKLMENSYWAIKLKEVKEQFVPINDHGYWLNWNETVLTQKLDVFFLVWETNEDAQVWLFNCIEYMAKVAKGYINSGRSYNRQASRYLNIIVESMIQHYRETINWNDKVKLWVNIQHPNQPNFSLFSILETSVRGNILGFLGRQIKINNEEFNSLLVEYAELNVKACREAIFARWEAIGKEGRKEIAGLFSELNEEILNENIQLLNKYLKYNASINYLDEVINWNIEDSLKKQILNTIIKSSPQHELNKWIIESLDFMNKKGNNYWLGYCIDYSIDEGLISGDLSENVIETSLNLGDERAKYALKLLDASGMSKGQMRRYRAKIEQLSDKHEELVEKIRMKQGWKFRKKSITK